MAKYKYIGNSRPNRENNKIYDGESKANAWCYSVSELAINFPYEWQLIQEKSPKELLIEEAKLKYPIGTTIINPKGSIKHEIRGDLQLYTYKHSPFIQITDGYGAVVYYEDGGWAEIIKEEPMCTEKTIKLSLDQARKMYNKSPEMDELLLANFSKEELTKKELPKSWNEARPTSGYKITYNSYGTIITKLPEFNHSKYDCKAIFATEKQAKSALAAAQISQLMAIYNDNWQADFSQLASKNQILCKNHKIVKSCSCNEHHFLTFKSAEIRDEFLKNFEPLIKEYFMID